MGIVSIDNNYPARILHKKIHE